MCQSEIGDKEVTRKVNKNKRVNTLIAKNTKMDEDILQELTLEDIELLSQKYSSFQREAPHVCSLLKTQILWKRRKPDLRGLTFFGVKNNWLESGTFILLSEISCYDLFVFTMEEDCKTLRGALTRTKKIDCSKKLQWYAVLARHLPTVLEVIKELKLPLDHLTETRLWVIEKEKALKFEINYPSDVCIKKLEKSHAILVNDYWPHKYEGSEEYLSTFIEMNDCYGVFLQSNGDLVCWVLKNHLGQLGILQTLPEYKRRGYATLIIKVMSKDIAEDGHDPLGTVLVGNIASERMFEKLGFHCMDKCSYIECF